MKRGMSGIITSVIIIGIALAAIGIVWFVINTVVSEQTAQVENSSSKVFQSCKDAGHYKITGIDECLGVVKYLGGEKCCDGNVNVLNGLVSYWSFDVDARDDWGDNNGTVTGATWNSTGGFNGKGAYEFDGVNDRVDVSKAINPNYTIGLWVKPNSPRPAGSSTQSLVAQNDGHGLYINSFYYTDFDALVLNNNISQNRWYHVIAVAGTSFKGIYLDGVLIKNVTNSIVPINWSSVKIGYGWGYFNGTIDEVRIYSRALSEDEVEKLYELE